MSKLLRDVDVWIAGREYRVQKCHDSARIRINIAEKNPPSDWYLWWVDEIRRQDSCWKKAWYFFKENR